MLVIILSVCFDWISKIYLHSFSGADTAKKELKTLTASVDILKLEKREHVQSK